MNFDRYFTIKNYPYKREALGKCYHCLPLKVALLNLNWGFREKHDVLPFQKRFFNATLCSAQSPSPDVRRRQRTSSNTCPPLDVITPANPYSNLLSKLFPSYLCRSRLRFKSIYKWKKMIKTFAFCSIIFYFLYNF